MSGLEAQPDRVDQGEREELCHLHPGSVGNSSLQLLFVLRSWAETGATRCTMQAPVSPFHQPTPRLRLTSP